MLRFKYQLHPHYRVNRHVTNLARLGFLTWKEEETMPVCRYAGSQMTKSHPYRAVDKYT